MNSGWTEMLRRVREDWYARRNDGLRGEGVGRHRSLPELRELPYPTSLQSWAAHGRPQGDEIPYNRIALGMTAPKVVSLNSRVRVRTFVPVPLHPVRPHARSSA